MRFSTEGPGTMLPMVKGETTILEKLLTVKTKHGTTFGILFLPITLFPYPNPVYIEN